MHDSTIVFFLVVLQMAVLCCCFLWCKSHCGIAWAAIRGIYRVLVVRSNEADTSNLAESGYAKNASPVPPPRQPQISSEQHQPLIVVPQMAHHFQPYHFYQPQHAIPDLPYPPANYPHQIGFVASDPRPYVRKSSPSKVTAPAAVTEKSCPEVLQPQNVTKLSEKHA